MTYDEYLKILSIGRPPWHREGQNAYNVLYDAHPNLADRVRGQKDLDPFYQNQNLPAFFAFVKEHWDE